MGVEYAQCARARGVAGVKDERQCSVIADMSVNVFNSNCAQNVPVAELAICSRATVARALILVVATRAPKRGHFANIMGP